MIRSTLVLASVLTLFSLSACVDEKGITEEADADTDTDTDSDADTDADTDADAYFEPVAVGFKYYGGWDSTTGDLVSYLYGGKEYNPYVLLVLADLDYFSATTEEDQDAHSCEIVTSYYHASASLTAETYDYGNGYGGDSVSLWDAWDGGLYFDESYLVSDACFNLDPDVYTDGIPVDLFNGIHFGFGFGPISQSLIELFGEDFADYEDSMFGIYQAVNHPTDDGGYDFIAYDWSYSNLYQWDDDREILVDDKGYLVPANIGDPNPQGYVSSGTYWYEDFPNLDLSILKDGAK